MRRHVLQQLSKNVETLGHYLLLNCDEVRKKRERKEGREIATR